MSNTSEQVKDALLDAAVQLAKDRYRSASPDQVERLIRLYYQRVAPQDLEDKDPIDLYGAAVRHWQLADQRAPTETLVRVYNPNVSEDGWGGTHTVIDVVNDDMPFIVDSVLAMLELEGRRVHVLVHPMAHVERDDEGKLVAIEAAANGDSTKVESFLHIEVDRISDPNQLAEMGREVTAVIHDVRAAVEDWMAMRARATELADELETWAAEPSPRYESTVGTEPTEVAALLRWMEQGAFTFVGYREYDFLDDEHGPRIESLPRTGLGTLRQTEVSAQALDQLPKETTSQARRPVVLNLTKANSLSTVHRAVPLDYVGIKRIDAGGKVIGERRFLGTVHLHRVHRSRARHSGGSREGNRGH